MKFWLGFNCAGLLEGLIMRFGAPPPPTSSIVLFGIGVGIGVIWCWFSPARNIK